VCGKPHIGDRESCVRRMRADCDRFGGIEFASLAAREKPGRKKASLVSRRRHPQGISTRLCDSPINQFYLLRKMTTCDQFRERDRVTSFESE